MVIYPKNRFAIFTKSKQYTFNLQLILTIKQKQL